MSIELRAAVIALIAGLFVVGASFGVSRLFAGSAAALPAPSVGAGSTSSSQVVDAQLSEQIIDGQNYYAASCGRCHGLDGTGINDAPNLHNEDLSDSDIAATIAQGSGRMPAFSGTYSGAQIKDLVEYIRTLK